MLKGFIVVAVESSRKNPELAYIFAKMDKVMPKENDINGRYFILDPQGEPVHGWDGHKIASLAEGVAQLKAPAPPGDEGKIALTLPDLCPSTAGLGLPAGLRLYVRAKAGGGGTGNGITIVQPVPVQAEAWKVLSLPDRVREIAPEVFEDCVTEIFPAAIRAASTPRAPGAVTRIQGTLTLEPAGSDGKVRFALVRGPVKLFYEGVRDKNNPAEPKFSGTLRAVVTYGLKTPEVRFLRGVIEGAYTYIPSSANGTFTMSAAVESRPE